MNVLAITTRDYYTIVNSAKWERINCPQITDFISELSEPNKSKDEKTRYFFIKEDDGREFWNNYRNKNPFFVLRRQQDDCLVYIAPSIPRCHQGEGKLCEQLITRQNYVGVFLHFIINDIQTNGTKIDNILLICHDADILPKDNNTNSEPERTMCESDLVGDGILTKCIKQGEVSIGNIYGFRHENNDSGVYRFFNGKLDDESLPEIFKQISDEINSSLSIQESPSPQQSHYKNLINFSFDVKNESVVLSQLHLEGYSIQLLSNTNHNTLVNDKFDLPDGTYNVSILIHLEDDIKKIEKATLYQFGQDLFINTDSPTPIIHFCDCSLQQANSYYRYASIMDSSIWNYYTEIELDKNNKVVKIKDPIRFRKVLETVVKNTDRKLYELSVAKEYAEFHARLTQQAYFRNFTQAHAEHVSPFIFHSEYEVEQLIKKEVIDENVIEKICEHKWRILLVDDKSNTKLSPYTKKQGNQEERLDNKIKILKHRLTDLFNEDKKRNFTIACDPFDNEGILIDYVEDYKRALERLKAKKYDIILLDYLLDKENGGDVRHYGYEVLESIRMDVGEKGSQKASDYKIGPCERLFFMFISAYTSAVHDRLLAEGLNLSEEFWHISLGACPTNTPQLFLYNLLKLMEKRMKDSGMLTLTASKISDLVTKIYDNKENGNAGYNVRQRANKYYEQVLSLHYHYRRIMKDVAIPQGNSIFDTKGSVLMTNFVQERPNLGGLLEHLTHLVYITAFGTIRQWPEMWEEFLYFKALFQELPDKDCSENDDSVKAMFNNIEKYILELKGIQG